MLMIWCSRLFQSVTVLGMNEYLKESLLAWSSMNDLECTQCQVTYRMQVIYNQRKIIFVMKMMGRNVYMCVPFLCNFVFILFIDMPCASI